MAGMSSSDNVLSIINHEERKYDTIPFRIDFVKKLLENKKLEPMINVNDLDNCQTENFTNPNGYRCVNSSSDDSSRDNASRDSRAILNKKIHDFRNVIQDLGGKLMYIKSGTTGHTFKGNISSETGGSVSYGVKVVAFPKKERYGDANDITRPENAELFMIRLLSYFIVKGQTPHIVMPIGSFDTSIKPFVKLIDENIIDKSNKKYGEFVEKYKKKEFYPEVSILISEWANKGDLLDFIRKYYKEFKLIHWKAIFFQIISVLAVIQSKFPGFRHNDMKANNILVHKVSPRNTKFSYTVVKKKYMVPNIGYIIKIWDFDFACIPGIVENSKVSADWTDEINVKPSKNQYYDLHFFFNTLIKRGFFPEFLNDNVVPREAKEFVFRVVPPQYQTGRYVTKKGRILVDNEYTTPNDVLMYDPFFEEFRYQRKKVGGDFVSENGNKIHTSAVSPTTAEESQKPVVRRSVKGTRQSR